MLLKNILEGKDLRIALHPTLVHFPIGLYVLSLLFDLATVVFAAGNALVRGAFYAMVLATVMALVAAIPGLMDRSDIRDDHPAKKLANSHMVLNLSAVGLYLFNLILRYGQLNAPQTPTVPLLLSLAGVGILSVAGYLGGRMVFEDGIGVGRHRRRTDSPEKTIRAAAGAPIAPASSLKDGETLRVEVEGAVMTIARVGDDFYAFQEFCTHRYGPLSEGHLEGSQIMCPWHGSCFDVRSGKVTQGPAKIDHKTYHVTVQDGSLRVRLESPVEMTAQQNGQGAEHEMAGAR